jgi:hypothetical protein
MLTIKNYRKLLRTDLLNSRYLIKNITEYPTFYDFTISNQTGYTTLIGIRRESLKDWNGIPTYQILLNGRDITCDVSKNYISDKNNMIGQIEAILKTYPF